MNGQHKDEREKKSPEEIAADNEKRRHERFKFLSEYFEDSAMEGVAARYARYTPGNCESLESLHTLTHIISDFCYFSRNNFDSYFEKAAELLASFPALTPQDFADVISDFGGYHSQETKWPPTCMSYEPALIKALNMLETGLNEGTSLDDIMTPIKERKKTRFFAKEADRRSLVGGGTRYSSHPQTAAIPNAPSDLSGSSSSGDVTFHIPDCEASTVITLLIPFVKGIGPEERLTIIYDAEVDIAYYRRVVERSNPDLARSERITWQCTEEPAQGRGL